MWEWFKLICPKMVSLHVFLQFLNLNICPPSNTIFYFSSVQILTELSHGFPAVCKI